MTREARLKAIETRWERIKSNCHNTKVTRYQRDQANTEFVDHAFDDLPWLLAQVRVGKGR